MRLFTAILFILLGAFLISLMVNGMGNIGPFIIKIIGLGCFFMALFIVKRKKEKNRERGM